MAKHLLGQIRQAVRELNPAQVRRLAERPLRLRIAAPTEEAYGEIADFLVPGKVSQPRMEQISQMVYREGDGLPPGREDLFISHVAMPQRGSFLYDPVRPEAMVRKVLIEREELSLPLARIFEPFRRPVTSKIIHTVATENTVFSLTTALPNVMPSVVSVALGITEAASDTVVLTVNQIRMAFLLAAASDLPIGYQEQGPEIGSLIAGAFGWRTLARELAGKIPFGGGLIPKAAIAYAGTYVVGQSLERLYRVGYGLSRDERRRAYSDALERGKSVASAVLEALRTRGQSS